MIETAARETPWQVEFRAGEQTGIADTHKNGVGGTAGMRPHELLEAALAACMTIAARMALTEAGAPEATPGIRVELDRADATSTFRYELYLDPAYESYREQVLERLESSPVRTTLSKELRFVAV